MPSAFQYPSITAQLVPNFYLARFQTGFVEIVKLFASCPHKCPLGRVKSTLCLIMTGAVERLPVLTFFNTLDMFIDIRCFFKQAIFIECIPVLAVFEGQGGVS